MSPFQMLCPCPGDHCGVVRTPSQGRGDKFKAVPCCRILQHLAQCYIGGDATGCNQGLPFRPLIPEQADGAVYAVGYGINHRGLEFGSQILAVFFGQGAWWSFLHGLSYAGFQPRETEVTSRAPFHGARQPEAASLAQGGSLLQGWPTRVAQAKHLGYLVKGFPRGIVNCGAQPVAVTNIFHHQNLAMSA